MALRRKAALGAAVVLVVLAVPVAPAAASGGGGCGEQVTNESGTEIEIREFCFTPTVLYAEAGDTVTWTNADPLFHNVGGANMAWGSFERMKKGRSVSYAFSEAGVYSYVCTMHPGMVGTVVVGDPGPGGTTASNSIRRITRVSAVEPGPVRDAGAQGDAVFWFATGVTVLALGGLLVGRKVRRRPAS
jgi:plastocyanin